MIIIIGSLALSGVVFIFMAGGMLMSRKRDTNGITLLFIGIIALLVAFLITFICDTEFYLPQNYPNFQDNPKFII